MKNILFPVYFTSGLLALPASGATVVAPYTNDFSANATDFALAPTSDWSVADGNLRVQSAGNNAESVAMLTVSNLGNGTDTGFIVSTTFTVASFSSETASVGFSALSSTDTNAGAFYLADIQLGTGGKLRLFRIAENASLASTSYTFSLDTAYTLTLTGTYATSGDLTLGLNITDGVSNSASIQAVVADADVLQGQNFGLRNRTAGTTGTLDASFDNFSITAVPEPSGAVLSLVAGTLALCLRRR